MTFKQLAIGQEFDFIGPCYPSFFLRCTKLSARKYQDENGVVHHIGSVSAKVYNVTPIESN